MNLEKIPQYELIKQERIGDIQSDGYLLRHRKSGARILVLQNEDENKVFNIAFRTTPTDSTGVAHILEHSVLCGSRLFPVKDPFVELVKGSLNTFLNAMTYPDKTMYPVASCNDRDFCNLMHVYLDAVFYPNIYEKEEIFRQEGWSYQLESPEDEIVYNGVVYNEMKGAFSTPEDVLEREIMNALFPDTTYGVESGGDPACIPDLKYEDFLDFHRRYYHPSNSYIYFYGNMDIEERLEWLDREYLSGFDSQPVDSAIRLQPAFDAPREVNRRYPISESDELEDNTYLSYNTVVGTGLDTELSTACMVLEYALLSAPGAVLKQALLDAGIGKDIMGSYESGLYQPFFSIVAKNANAGDRERFAQVIRETLERLVKDGIDRKALLAGINAMEFRAREADYGSFPKGLMYGIAVFDSWLYDDNMPFDYLKFDVYDRLRQRAETGYFEELIRTGLLENTHAAYVTVEPERGLTARTERAVADRLHAYKLSLSPQELQQVIDNTAKLRAFQETPSAPEELERIPMLTRGDIGRRAAGFENTKLDWDGMPVLHHDIFTNGIAYLDLLFEAGDLEREDIPYLGVLKAVLGMVDTEHYTFQDLNNEINIHTGGISAGVSVYPVLNTAGRLRIFAGVRASVLYDKIPFALQMAEEILLHSRLEDDKRLYEILANLKSRLSMQLSSAGHMAAAERAMSYFSQINAFNDAISGISFYQLTEDLEKHFDERRQALKEKLLQLMRKLFCRERLFLSVTCDGPGLERVHAAYADFAGRLPSAGTGAVKATEAMAHIDHADTAEHRNPAGTLENAGAAEDAGTAENAGAAGDTDAVKCANCRNNPEKQNNLMALEKKNEGFMTPGQVQYVARAGNFIQKGYAYSGLLRIVKVMLSYDYLWVNIRVKGGAYGCMNSFGRTGDAYFVSFRDPHLASTDRVFEGVPAYLEHFEADEREMTKYIIGTVSDLDTPLTPQQKGRRALNAYFSGVSGEDMQRERDEILEATPQQIRALAPLVQAVLDEQAFCVIGNENKIRSARGMFGSIQMLTNAVSEEL